MTKRQQKILAILTAAIPHEGEITWGKIVEAVAHQMKIKDWTEVRAVLQTLRAENKVARVDSVHIEAYRWQPADAETPLNEILSRCYSQGMFQVSAAGYCLTGHGKNLVRLKPLFDERGYAIVVKGEQHSIGNNRAHLLQFIALALETDLPSAENLLKQYCPAA